MRNQIKKLIVLLLGTSCVLQIRAATLLMSTPLQSALSAAGNSFNPVFSADGKHVVFVSHANNLVTNDDLGLWLDVFVRDLVTSNTVLVSVSASGIGGANADANYPSVSSNGQYIAFASRANNLVAGDTNGASDAFVRDMISGVTHLVSVDGNGNSPVDSAPSLNVPLSGYPQISADGRWVFFESRATNLITGGAPLGSVNIYRRDTWNNLTVLVTSDTNGNALVGSSTLAGISSDARYVAFITTNQSVIPGVNNAGPDVYVRDMQTGVTLWASTNVSLLLGGAYACSSATIAANGSGVALNATALNSGDTFPFYFDLPTRIRQRLWPFAISNAPPIISADGSGVAFEASNNGWTQILLWNRASNITSVVHQKLFGNYSGNGTHVDALSSNLRFIIIREFASDYFSNFVARYHLFRKDLASNTLDLVSATTSNTASTGSFEFSAVAFSLDGNLVAFDSTANDLSAGDLNGASDIFLRDVNAAKTELVTEGILSKPSATSFAHSFLGPNSVSFDGRFVVSLRYDDPSANRDTNAVADVFVSDALSGTSIAVSINTNLFVTNSGGGGPSGDFIENTNFYRAPIISADGSTVAAIRNPSSAYSYIAITRTSNGVFTSTGMSVVSRGTFASFSDTPVLGSDGQLVVFRSDANDLNSYVPDFNNASDIWAKYVSTNTNAAAYGPNYCLTVRRDGSNTGTGPSIAPVLSVDDGTVALATKAGDLLPNAAGGSDNPYSNYQIVAALIGTDRGAPFYLRSVPKRLCSYSIAGYQQVEWSDVVNTNLHYTNVNILFAPVTTDTTNVIFSRDGHYLFYSFADGSAIWRHDLWAQHTNVTILSYTVPPAAYVSNNVVPGASNILTCTTCRNPSSSADGNVVAYERLRPSSSVADVFARDMSTGEETLVSGNLSGGLANGSSTLPQVSGDGRYVVFTSRASDLVVNDTNLVSDVFVRDRLLGVTMLVSANAQGRSGNGPSTRPVLTADGRTVVFQSMASDLVTGDYNDKRDVFLLKLSGADSDGDGMDDDWEVAYFGNLSRNGLVDFDGDGVSDLQEFRDGTDPTNSNSVFRVLTVAPASGGSKTLMWIGNPTRNYRAEYKDTLDAPTWTALTGAISWNSSTASIVDPAAGAATNRFYRAVRLP